MEELRRHVAVVGGGPAGLMAAEVLAGCGMAVTVYEQHRTVGRKLLIAGRGGLNLTHSEPLDAFLARYPSLPQAVEAAVRAFPPAEVRAWAASLGQATFVGTSGRVFPEVLRATPLVRAWLGRLRDMGVEVVTGARLDGWPDVRPGGGVRVPLEGGAVESDAVLLALGGASWPRTGSDGRWVEPAARAGVDVTPLVASNAGWLVRWSAGFAERFAGSPLKNVAVTVGDRTVRGEALITAAGLEGGAVYALGAPLRDRLGSAGGPVTVIVDLRPDLDTDRLVAAMARRRSSDSASTVLRRGAGLSPAAAVLVREVAGAGLPVERASLAALVKSLPLSVAGIAPIERAISTAGGVAPSSLGGGFMIADQPGVFVAGEMLDWDAPTGGYLLTACLATGAAAARQIAGWTG